MARFEDFADNELYMLIAGLQTLQQHWNKQIRENRGHLDLKSGDFWQAELLMDLHEEGFTEGLKRKE